MGDFNIDLLKVDSNKDSNAFYNNVTSRFFTPFILQATRLKSMTLIDNIFINSIEYPSYRGNLTIQLSGLGCSKKLKSDVTLSQT